MVLVSFLFVCFRIKELYVLLISTWKSCWQSHLEVVEHQEGADLVAVSVVRKEGAHGETVADPMLVVVAEDLGQFFGGLGIHGHKVMRKPCPSKLGKKRGFWLGKFMRGAGVIEFETVSAPAAGIFGKRLRPANVQVVFGNPSGR